MSSDRAPVNPVNPVPPGEPASALVFNLIFNGLTAALTEDQWMPLSERLRVTAAIYDTLHANGAEIRVRDGLARLRAVGGAS